MQKLGSRNLRSCAEVARVVTGILSGPETASDCFMGVMGCNRDQAEGHLLRQMNYIPAWLNVPKWSPNHSAGDVNWTLGLADDYLILGNRVSSEGR